MRSIHRLPVTGPNQDRAVEAARQILEKLEAAGDPGFEGVVESAWRSARGKSRWILAARSSSDMITSLAEFVLEGNALASGTHRGGQRRVTFVFSGMGPQWAGMGRRLFEELPTFRERIKLIDDLISEHYGASVWDELDRYEITDQLPTVLAQPANFLIQAAVHDLLVAEGVIPEAVIGHSAGEVASAYAAGVYNLSEAARVAVTRGRLQAQLAGRGAMLAVGLGEEDALELISEFDGVDLAAVNDHDAVTVAGDAEQIALLEERLRNDEVFAKTLRVEVPYHSPVMDEIADDLREQMSFIAPKPAQIPLYSTVSGELSSGDEWGADYWPRNVRQPVRFAKALEAALEDGSSCFIEIAPHPVLTQSITALVPSESTATVTPLLSRRDDEYEMFVGALGALALEGVGRPPRGKSADLVPLERVPQSLWDLDPWYDEYLTNSVAVAQTPLLGQRVQDYENEFQVEVSLSDQPWIEGHQAAGLGPVVPATMWAELVGLAATRGEDRSVTISDLTIVAGLPVFANPTLVRTSVAGGIVRVHSRSLGDTQGWNLNVVASIGAPVPASDETDPAFLPATGQPLDTDALYSLFRLKGLQYSELFRNLSDVVLEGDGLIAADGTATGELAAWATIEGGKPFVGGWHAPWVLDAGLQLMIAASRDLGESMYLPFRIGEVRLIRPMNEAIRYHARAVVRSRLEQEIVGDIRFFDDEGRLCAELTEVVAVRNQSDDVGRRSYLDRNSYAMHPVTPLEVVERFLPEEEDLDGELEDASDLVASDVDLGAGEVADDFDEPPASPEHWVTDSGGPIDARLDRPVSTLDQLAHGEGINVLWPVPNTDRTKDAAIAFAFVNRVFALEDQTLTLTLVGAPGQEWLFGLRRAAANASGLTVRVLLTDSEVPSEDLEMWTAALDEVEIRLEGETRLNRFEKLTTDDIQSCAAVPTAIDADDRWTLAFDMPSISKVTATLEPVPAPGPGEVTIETIAVPLTWKDVGKVTGAIGANALATFAGNHLSLGAVGRVVEVGEGTDFAVGDIVGGAIRRPFRKLVTVNARDEYVCLVNDNIDPAVQVALMMPWVTVLAALDDIAKVQPGQRLFIQSGAGALGSAMCHHALKAGCKVVTSVGTADKVDAVRNQLGESIDVVVARGDEIPGALTAAGHGDFDCIVAVVNGPARTSLFKQLRPRGQYIDLGKAQSSDELQLATAIDGNRSMARVDTDQIAAADHEWFRDLVARALAVVADESNHTEVTTYPIGELRTAILDLARGTTTGSLVVDLRTDSPVDTARRTAPSLERDGFYLITGGYGAVGLMVAQWMVSRGARKLVLTGRSGRVGERGQATIDLLEAFGAEVRVVAADVGDAQATQSLIDELRAEATINGIVHAAGVIADGGFDEIDADRVRQSMGAKVDGANNLVDALDQRDGAWDELDFMLLTSSLSGALGVSIQGTYAAANTALDGLAEDLHARGVQACAMQLGPIAEAGMAADDERNIRLFAAAGLSMVAPRNLYGILDLALTSSSPVVASAEIDWQKVGRSEPGNSKSSVIGHLVAAASVGGASELGALLELSVEDRSEVLTIALLALFTEALGLEEGDIVADTGFSDMGIDSLAVVEIQAGIGEILQYEVPLARLFLPDANVGHLAARIAEYLDEIDLDEIDTDTSPDAEATA